MTAFVGICIFIGIIIVILVAEACLIIPDKLFFWKRKKK